MCLLVELLTVRRGEEREKHNGKERNVHMKLCTECDEEFCLMAIYIIIQTL